MFIHHLALGARDVVSLAEFYTAAFELPVEKTHHNDDGTVRSIWLQMSEGVLMIEHVENASHEREPTMKPGLFLIAFRVDDSEREMAEARAIEAGAMMEERAENTTYFRDLEGNRIAISRYPLN